MEDRVRTIALVGNGPVDPGHARFLESHDLIIRFNDCRSYPQCPTRTDIVAVCNIGRSASAMIFSYEWRGLPCIQQTHQIWSVFDPDVLPALRQRVKGSRLDIDDLFDDYTSAFSFFCHRESSNFVKHHAVIRSSIYHDLTKSLRQVCIAPYITASTGMITLAAVRNIYPNAIITLVGFTHEGWSGHPHAGERLLIEKWSRTSRILKLSPDEHRHEIFHEPLNRPLNPSSFVSRLTSRWRAMASKEI